MRGHIAPKGTRWYPVVSLRDPGTGDRIVKWHGGHATKREAARALTEILGRIDAGSYVSPSRTTLGEYLQGTWLPAIRATVRPATFESYRDSVRTHLVPRLGAIPLQQLTAPRLNATYADLLENGKRDGRGGLAPRTVRYAHTILRKALADAVAWNLIARNPADAAKPPRQAKLEHDVWTAEELRRFLAHIREHRLYAAFLLLATTGMRRGELLGLRWQDVKLDAGRLSITRTWIAPNGEQQASTPKTSKGIRHLALDAGTVAALRDHREAQQLEQLMLGAELGPDALAFCDELGEPLNPGAFSKLFLRLSKAAGCLRIRLHDLRHTYATLALRAGVHPKIVSERLGHSTISITLDTYSHALPVLEESAAELIAALIHE